MTQGSMQVGYCILNRIDHVFRVNARVGIECSPTTVAGKPRKNLLLSVEAYFDKKKIQVVRYSISNL